MITEIVFFDLPNGTTREEAAALYRKSAANWAANPDLLQKFYIHDPEKNVGGGVYIWPDRATALRWHGAEYRAMVQRVYGSEPRIEMLDTVIRVTPESQSFEEIEPEAESQKPLVEGESR